MTETGTRIEPPAGNSADVDAFARRFHLENSLRVTKDLTRLMFGQGLVDSIVTVQDDIPEEDEVAQMLVVEIFFKGERALFHDAYSRFVPRWAKIVSLEHHALIQFRFHIVDS